jgi:hypothetical protein
MEAELKRHVANLLREIQKIALPDFIGVGLIFYIGPMRLPVVPLGDEKLFHPSLPILGANSIARILAEISQASHVWHDGFHLIERNLLEFDQCKLTHVCQFVSPPLHFLDFPRAGELPIGARRKSAMAISKLENVCCAALLTKGFDAIIFYNGFSIEI